MELRASVLAIGVGALLIGALLGGALVGLLLGPRFEPEPVVVPPSGSAPALEARIAHLLEELVGVTRRLEGGLPAQFASERQPVTRESAAHEEALLDAIERLTLALDQAWASGRSGGSGPPPLVIPASRTTRDELAGLFAGDPDSLDSSLVDELSRRLRFLTYQQVLDRFGPPDTVFVVSGLTNWVYEMTDARGRICRVFLQFSDGYLVNVDASR